MVCEYVMRQQLKIVIVLYENVEEVDSVSVSGYIILF